MPVAPKLRPLARGDACQSCKSRKVRCPAEKPACANCVKKSRECIYKPTPPSEDFPTSLHETYHAFSSGASPAAEDPGSSSSTSKPPTSITASSSFGSVGSKSTLTPLLDPPGYQDSPWSFNLNTIGLLPSMGSQEQRLPLHWEDVDLSALLGQRNIDPEILGLGQTELSEAERDHLLLLYFTGQRTFGIDMHISTFYTRLQSPDPDIRPHPCILNGIYLMTCRGSPLESLRSRELHFYTRARECMEQAMTSPVFVFDALRTGIMLAAWLFGSDRHLEGWVMLGQAVSHLGSYLPTATSQLELADRIHTFWTLFLADRYVSIGFELPAGISLSRITTPLPRSWEAYEKNDPHLHASDSYLCDLLKDASAPSHPCDAIHKTEMVYMIFAVELMYQVSLRPGLAEERRLGVTLTRLLSSLPPELKQTKTSDTGKLTISSDTASLQLITLYTEMWLCAIDMVDRPDPRALEAARRIVGVLHLLKDSNIGDVNLFAMIIWTRVARMMIWESKRLESTGDTFGAAHIAKDVQFIASCLQQLSHITLASECLKSIQEWWKHDLATFGVEHSREAHRDHR
ncbi:uncharacterized protein IL334_005150 [Kwoniella shivajii]|uniref:Zn(2)-C6 fungal-type domain-containing protein n=1 Tax=Kwoniella shivajii TaxID=564305 RepID=A0ABZ1D2Q5_9TREE|nr:hypothetical protein IL334_005150 [Kwoniella shivajii]